MKEVTEWDNNPRMMWVWNSSLKNKEKAKVIYIAENVEYPVMTITNNDFCIFRHCAEIETERRMTKQEFAWWLKGNPTREWKYVISDVVKGFFTYSENEGSTLVDNDIVIRENGGEWREPLVEVEE